MQDLFDRALKSLSSVAGRDSDPSELVASHSPEKRVLGDSRTSTIPILILGRFGSPKTRFINSAHASMEVAPDFVEETKEVHTTYASISGYKFKLIDTPGFDDPERSNLEVFEKIATYLADNKVDGGVTGIVYVHYAGHSAEGRAMRQAMNVLSGVILGRSSLERLTMVVVPIAAEGSGHAASVALELETLVSSIFCPTRQGMPRSMVSNLDETDVEDILLGYATKDLVRLRIQRQFPDDLRGRIEASLGYCETDSMMLRVEHEKEFATRYYRSKITPLLALLDEQNETIRSHEESCKDLEDELSRQRDENLKLRQQLYQTQMEHSSLRSQLQLQENVEQREIVQTLKDLNRSIDDIGRSFAAYLIDKFVKPMFDKDPSLVTTLDAQELPELKRLFSHVDGHASLVASSSGVGMVIEDFFDYAIRSLLCAHLCRHIFSPFHPGIDRPYNKMLAFMYDEIQQQEPQLVSAKWRASCFKSVSRPGDVEEIERLMDAIAHDFFGGTFAAVTHSFFGKSQGIQFDLKHLTCVRQLVQKAWDWNVMLKSQVIVLGDFYQTCYQPLSPFKPAWQEEFEPRSGVTPSSILCTLALGLISSRAVGGRKPPESAIICKAMVATEAMYNCA